MKKNVRFCKIRFFPSRFSFWHIVKKHENNCILLLTNTCRNNQNFVYGFRMQTNIRLFTDTRFALLFTVILVYFLADIFLQDRIHFKNWIWSLLNFTSLIKMFFISVTKIDFKPNDYSFYFFKDSVYYTYVCLIFDSFVSTCQM